MKDLGDIRPDPAPRKILEQMKEKEEERNAEIKKGTVSVLWMELREEGMSAFSDEERETGE